MSPEQHLSPVPCHQLCVEKILAFRNNGDFAKVIDAPDQDLYTPRSARRAFSRAVKDARDIANTCKNWLVAAQLVNVLEGDGLERIEINLKYRDKIEDAIAREQDFIRNHDHPESFQRQYGCWDRQKDTRSLMPADSSSVTVGKEIIVAKFYDYCRERMVNRVPYDLVEEIVTSDGLEEKLIVDTIKPLLGYGEDYFETEFIEMSRSGGEYAIEFERAVCNIFQERFRFDVKHTGQLRREGKGNYADGFAVALDNRHCALIDAKASQRYSLNSSDYYKMKANYIPNHVELTDGRKLTLEFCVYVAGGFKGSITNDLQRLRQETNIPATAIDSHDLLAIAKRFHSESAQPALRNVFSKGGHIEDRDFPLYPSEDEESGGFSKAADPE